MLRTILVALGYGVIVGVITAVILSIVAGFVTLQGVNIPLTAFALGLVTFLLALASGKKDLTPLV